MEFDLVRCPIGHGPFITADDAKPGCCPDCGAPLLAVCDEFPSVTPANWLNPTLAEPTKRAAPRPPRQPYVPIPA